MTSGVARACNAIHAYRYQQNAELQVVICGFLIYNFGHHSCNEGAWPETDRIKSNRHRVTYLGRIKSNS